MGCRLDGQTLSIHNTAVITASTGCTSMSIENRKSVLPKLFFLSSLSFRRLALSLDFNPLIFYLSSKINNPQKSKQKEIKSTTATALAISSCNKRQHSDRSYTHRYIYIYDRLATLNIVGSFIAT